MMKLTVNNPFNTFYRRAEDVIVFDDIIPEVYQNWLIDCVKNPELVIKV